MFKLNIHEKSTLKKSVDSIREYGLIHPIISEFFILLWILVMRPILLLFLVGLMLGPLVSGLIGGDIHESNYKVIPIMILYSVIFTPILICKIFQSVPELVECIENSYEYEFSRHIWVINSIIGREIYLIGTSFIILLHILYVWCLWALLNYLF